MIFMQSVDISFVMTVKNGKVALTIVLGVSLSYMKPGRHRSSQVQSEGLAATEHKLCLKYMPILLPNLLIQLLQSNDLPYLN